MTVSRRERERGGNSREGEEKLEMWEPDESSALLAAKMPLTGGGTSGEASTGGSGVEEGKSMMGRQP